MAALAENTRAADDTAATDAAINDRSIIFMAFIPDPSCGNCRKNHANHGPDHKRKIWFVIPLGPNSTSDFGLWRGWNAFPLSSILVKNRRVRLPLTPQRVWQSIQEANR